jgi:hypothetical protein
MLADGKKRKLSGALGGKFLQDKNEYANVNTPSFIILYVFEWHENEHVSCQIIHQKYFYFLFFK